MKRTLAMVLATTLALTLLASCSPKEPDTSTPDTSKPSISEPDVSKPDTSKPDVSKPDTSKPDVSEPTEGVDLAAFYETLAADFEMPMGMGVVDGEMRENMYTGLAEVEPVQSVVVVSQMSMSNAEYAFVEVADEADVDAVKAIFQARIDAQVDGGAFYPEATEIWNTKSQIVTNGNFVMMVVDGTNGDAIVESFNALFA